MNREASGRLQVIAGPMFSGKSEELLRRVRRATLAGRDVVVVNHALDARYGAGEVASHAGLRIASTPAPDVPALTAILARRDPDLLAIDEAQFFGPGLTAVVEERLARGVDVVIAGLSVTFDARPFDPLPALMALAEEVVKLTAICMVCGADAAFHQRIHADDGGADSRTAVATHVGGTEKYEARCRRHFG